LMIAGILLMIAGIPFVLAGPLKTIWQ
jgi:hypothetical protein